MKTYVVGFLFDEAMEHVLLLHKHHGPPCVVGRWNGVGGEIETGESPHQTMVREFEEETGVQTKVATWEKFIVLTSETAIVHFFYAVDDYRLLVAHTTTDEEVRVFDTEQLPQVVSNLAWMIPFLCDPFTVHNLGEVKMAVDPVV
jgi:8-oxo-dGTP diphosphatase